jgi:putative FmdB family regulatory protein
MGVGLGRGHAVAIYEYRCELDGLFEVIRAMGTAPESVTCAVCGREAKRVVSMPMIASGTRSAWFTAIERAEKSRHEPDVVTSLPASGARRRTRMAPLTPALRRLPRP